MENVTFDSYRSYDDFRLILDDYVVNTATRKTNFVSIPGRNGDLDLSDFLGVAYENRTITITFHRIIDRSELYPWLDDLETKLNGNRMKVVFDNDSDYYWNARVSIDSVTKSTNGLYTVTISLNCDPYKVNVNTGEEVL